MPVDSFKYLPRIIATFYQMTDCRPELPIPWTPLPRPPKRRDQGLATGRTIALIQVMAPHIREMIRQKRQRNNP